MLWIRTKRRTAEDLRFDVIGERFPQIWTLCTVEDIFTYVRDGGPGDSRRRTPVQAVNEIMQQLFPTVPLESIERMGRKSR